MTNKNVVTLVAVLGVIALGIGGIYAYSQQMLSQNSANTNGTSTNYNPQTQGKVVLGIKDAAANMANISSVMITVNQIDVHSQSQGWVTVSTATQQYDLLALKASGATALLAQANVDAGTYDQIRLQVSKVVVTQNGVQSEAKLPSGELKLMGTFVVNADKTSTAVFDFMTDKSLHVTGNGKFIFTPVIKMETQSDADATVDSDSKVHINNGHVDADTNEGMDINGEMKENFELDANTKIDLINDVLKVTTKDEESNHSIKVNSDAATSTVVNGGYLDTAVSVMMETQNGKKEWVVSGLKNLTPTSVEVDATTGAVINAGAQSRTQSSTQSNTQINTQVNTQQGIQY